MPRKKRECGRRGAGKSIIKVFCEGESEQAYTEYLKRKFSDVAVIQYPKEPGLFDRAEERFKKDPQYRDYTEVIADLKVEEPLYEKGNRAITAKIAEDHPIAVKNAARTMNRLLEDGMPMLEDTDVRNQWLCKNCKTFSNVHEAIKYLENL